MRLILSVGKNLQQAKLRVKDKTIYLFLKFIKELL
ncbi:hypothetical protein BCO_0900144 (plasmid) [Borrelia coriaceae ATCC 43381]|uniref:Uncharacterized protein n=1 Tax=Borrelia coriaceae ATCC 43381 TaxID=1408429 RepID=W5SYP3_9SPIR|nr:hypothetical protein BCO_0900144 [Borrelia coriaceae ATCC 43381]